MFRWKAILIFCVAVGISLVAASYRFGDSSHAIGMLNLKGGKSRHPFMLNPGHDRYTLILTGTVLPPFAGDIKVALEGSPVMNYSIYNSEPPVDLGIHARPTFKGNNLLGVQSGDKLALWVVMKPEPLLVEDIEDLFRAEPAPAANIPFDDTTLSSATGQSWQDSLKLSFYAANTGQQLLQVPVVFADFAAGGGHGSHH